MSLDIKRVLTALKLVLEFLRVRYGYWVAQPVMLGLAFNWKV